jgi:cytochrome P450
MRAELCCVAGALQICVERLVSPGWRLTELFNGKRATLNACCDVVHSFAMNIIQKRRQQMAEQAAARAKAAADPAAGTTDSGSADGSAEVSVQGKEEGDSSAQDLLSLFMQSTGLDGRPLNDKELMDTVINFIIAGRDTTAQVGAL